MYSIGIEIPKWNEDQLHVFDDFVRTCVEAVTVTDLVITTKKICIKSYFVDLDARDISYEI